jgi:rhodanese-related sulfurtransferase
VVFLGNQVTSRRQISSALHLAVGRSLTKEVHHPCGLAVKNANSVESHFASIRESRLFSSLSNDGSSAQQVNLKHVGWEEMQQLVEEYESSGRDGSGLVVIDVREPHEIEFTGKVSPNTYTLPLGVVAQYNVFTMDNDDFEEVTGFKKPSMDETIIFSCAAGVRSVHACNFAARAGYSQLVNYMGGANEWFSK